MVSGSWLPQTNTQPKEDGMTDQDQTPQPAIVRAFMHASPAEQHLLLGWSRSLTEIRLSDRTAVQKLRAIAALTRERRAGWPLLKLLGRAIRALVWDARSWRFRLGLGALFIVFTVSGTSAAALVPLMNGISLPLWILVGSAGFLVGMAIDLVLKHRAGA
jgi:hypothetical protein